MNRFAILFSLFIVCICVNITYSSQQLAKVYGGKENNYAFSLQQTIEGGYILAGSTSSFGAGENDFWVLKLDRIGNIPWQKTYGGSGNDYVTAFEQTLDGGYIVVGNTRSFGAGRDDAWVIKLDSSGGIIWQNTYGGRGRDYASSVHETADGDYIVIGNTSSYGAGRTDIWVLKLDGNGNISWQRTYGGTDFDWAFSILKTIEGLYVIVGSTFSFGAGEDDIWVLKLDTDGEILWQKTYGGSSYDWGFSIQETPDQGYLVAGNTFSFGAGYDDIWLLKLNANGGISWQKTYGGSYFDWPSAVKLTSTAEYVVVGGTYSFGLGKDDLWVLRLDGNGNVKWQKTYGGSGNDYANDLQLTSDGGYIVTGTTSSFGASQDDIWILRLSSEGSILGCNIDHISDASVSHSSARTLDTNCSFSISNATVIETVVLPRGSSAAVKNSCLPQAVPWVLLLLLED